MQLHNTHGISKCVKNKRKIKMKKNIKKIFTKKLRWQLKVILCSLTVSVATVLLLYVAQSITKPVVLERVQLVLVDDSLSTSATDLLSISDGAILKRISSIKEIELNTDVMRYSERLFVVSSDHQELKTVAYDLGYKIVQVN